MWGDQLTAIGDRLTWANLESDAEALEVPQLYDAVLKEGDLKI